jgi:MerR family transcriptional regulator, copper efflux regulator
MIRLRSMEALRIADAAAGTGWSARMLRYLETLGLVVPSRTPAGYRLYGGGELLQLRQLRQLREQFGIELDEIAFAARLRREPELRIALDAWMRAAGPGADWVEWEQRKHERLISAA